MHTRVVFNQKGGVGKSSITVNLAAISAHQGLKLYSLTWIHKPIPVNTY